MTSTPTARSVLRSRNTAMPECVVSTLLLRMPRIILAEFNTHRVFSRNAASTRAIPTEKLIQQVVDDPFIPLVWGANQSGMQAAGEVDDRASCEASWLKARDAAVDSAERLMDLGLHKQIVGRVLEPWMWTIVCVSSTEWNNFLELRDHAAAEPHIQMLAREIRKCLEDESAIQDLLPGQWHLPFVEKDLGEVWAHLHGPYIADGDVSGAHIPETDALDLARKLSVSRCASTSYKTVDGFDMTPDRAIALHDKLVSSRPIHASPAEHVCIADFRHETLGWQNKRQHGNFVGFAQYRHMLAAAQ